jgi:hypothetical protein
MKSLLFTLVIFGVIAAHKCTKEKESIPSCIQQKINEIKKQPRWNPPAEVYEYRYQGKKVYYVTSDCCDNFNTVYDENCNYLCAPDGGITGKGDRKCADFTEKAERVKLIWKDDR